MKIAIVGSGISGLVAAYLLSRHHDITVFERNDYIGGHTHTVPVDHDGVRYPVDTGFIVFNRQYYPNFTTLLDRLGVASQPTSMSFSVRCDHTGLEYNGSSLNGLFAQRRNLLRPGFWRMLRDFVRFSREAPALLSDDADHVTVEDYVRSAGYGESFTRHYLVPLGSSLWSAPPEGFRRFPMRFVVAFLHQHGMLQVRRTSRWRVVAGGSWRYVDAVTRTFRDRVRVRCPVRSVRRHRDEVELSTADGQVARFDHVVMACHADTALRLVGDASPQEREILGAFPYQPNEVILHTDTAVLPRRRRAWASWNYHCRIGGGERVGATYNMNMLQGLRAPQTFCVTLNEDGIDPSRVIERIPYEHPIATPGRSAATRRHAELINANRTSYCGAYWGYGFHEDGVNSALAVCRAFGAGL